MSPHSNQYTKTKEGYIVAIEEELNINKNLPKAFYRLDIDSACDLYNATIVSGKIGFIEKSNEFGLSYLLQEVFDE